MAGNTTPVSARRTLSRAAGSRVRAAALRKRLSCLAKYT